jgi:hypothetical protein
MVPCKSQFADFVKKARNQFPKIVIIAGNVATPEMVQELIIAGADYLKIAPKLVRVARDAPLPKVDLALPKAPSDLSAIYQFKERYALGASVDRLISALGW